MYIPHHELLDYRVKCEGVVESRQLCVQCEWATPCGETGHFSANQKDNIYVVILKKMVYPYSLTHKY